MKHKISLSDQAAAVELSTLALRNQIEMMETRVSIGKPWPADDIARRRQQLEAERAALETLRELEKAK